VTRDWKEAMFGNWMCLDFSDEISDAKSVSLALIEQSKMSIYPWILLRHRDPSLSVEIPCYLEPSDFGCCFSMFSMII
jgi:hypothetical protein